MSGVPVTAKIYLLQMEPTSFFLFFFTSASNSHGEFHKRSLLPFSFFGGEGGD